MNIDNLAEKFISNSPYHYAGNNPIVFIDVDGNQFTDAMQEWINKLTTEITRRKTSNNKSIENARKTIKSGKFSLFQSEKSLLKKIENLENENNELDVVTGEISKLEESDQMYDVVYAANGTTTDALGNTTTTNSTGFNFSNGNLEITVSSGTSIGLFAHELKHAHQFEVGQYSVGRTLEGVSYRNLFYDRDDEIVAHNRGKLFGVPFSGKLSSDYSKYPTGPYDFRNIPETSTAAASGNSDALKQLSKNTGHAFRINGVTYYTKR